MLLDLILLVLRNLFGANLRPVAPPPLPSPAEIEADEPDLLDPVPPVPPAAPQILIPDPIHADRHGPASSIARAMLRKGYAVFEKDDESHNLNIVAIRTAAPEFDRFRCRLAHFWKHRGEWQMETWPITTLPGHRYMVERLLNPKGCAILVPGQYRGAYALDYHRGSYEALCQRGGPVRVYRDGDRDRVYDMDPATIMSGSFGINVHATENPDDGISRNLAERIGSASAGCLVYARVTDFVEARKQWRNARTNWGRKFTLTLLDEADLDDAGSIPHESVDPQISTPEPWHPPAPGTTGTRNRNLLNVKQGADKWKHSTGQDSRGHAIFPTYAAGIRAGIIVLRSYWTRHRRRTLRQIAERWAPVTDTIGSLAGAQPNDPGAYARFLAKRLGIGADDPLRTFHDAGTVRDPEQLFALVAAMVVYENGNHVVLPRAVFDEGMRLL